METAATGRSCGLILIICALAMSAGIAASSGGLTISDSQALAAGRRLWKNECGGTVSGLTSWNAGENFASLGIGHYIWYPVGERGPFEESFPELVRFLADNHVAFPSWLNAGAGCRWKTRAEFEHAQN
jgi:hypothetical protein